MVNFATTMACVIVISYSVERPKRNQSVKQRNVLAFRDSGFWRIRVNLPPPRPLSVIGQWAMSVGPANCHPP